MLVSFNFVPPDFDIDSYLNRNNDNGLLGFYIPYSKEIYIVTEDYRFDLVEEVVYAHETAHAIQDQTFGLREEYNLEQRLLSFEGDLPYLALVEGEARFIEQQFLESNYFDRNEYNLILENLYTITPEEKEKLDKIPQTLINSSQFPYQAGSEFIKTLYESGGWDAINQVWEKPPKSTEQILHPEKYITGETAQALLIPFPGQPWKSIDTGVLGEFFLREYLQQQLSKEEVDIAATGWGGDAYKILIRTKEGEDDAAMIYHTAWDSELDQEEFFGSYIRYANNNYGMASESRDEYLCWSEDTTTCLFDAGNRVIIVRASDLETAINIMSTQKK